MAETNAYHPDVQPCPHCGGCGREYDDSIEIDLTGVPCQACEGTGELDINEFL